MAQTVDATDTTGRRRDAPRPLRRPVMWWVRGAFLPHTQHHTAGSETVINGPNRNGAIPSRGHDNSLGR